MPSQVRGMTPEAIRALFKRSFDAQADQLTLKLSNYNDEVSAMKNAMDESLAALNKDVDASINAARSEAKQANDAIQALDAFDKAVASQISGVLDQSQSAIAEANALLAQMPELKKKAQDAIDKVKSVQESLSNAVEEQLKVSPALAELSNKLDSTNESLSNLNNDYKSVSNKVSDITGQVEPLSKQAKQAADDAQKAVDALRNPIHIGSSLLTVDQVTGIPHWTKDASVSDQKTPDGDEVWYVESTQKTSYFKAPYVTVDSRIPYKMSFWARADGDGSLITMDFLDKNGDGAVETSEGDVKVSGRYFPHRLQPTQQWKKYETVVRFKTSVESVQLFCIRWNDMGINPTQQYIGGFKFFPLIPDQAEIDTLQNNAILKNTKIGTSNTNAIDAINDGLKAQATLNQKQQEWNAVQKIVNDNQLAWNKTQETVNKNQSKWNQAVLDYQSLNDRLWGAQGKIDAAQTRADEGFYKAIKALSMPEEANSLFAFIEPSDAEVKAAYESGKADTIVYDQPEWTLFSKYPASRYPNNYDQVHLRNEWTIWANTNDGTVSLPASKVTYTPVIKGVTYKLSFSGYTAFDNGVIYLQFLNQGESNCFGSVTGFVDGVENSNYSHKGSTSYVGPIRLLKGVHQYEFRIEMTPDTTSIRMCAIHWNHPEGNQGRPHISAMHFVPDIPSQAEIDKAQNNAIINNSNAIAINNWSDRIQAIVNENQQKQIEYNKSLYNYVQRWTIIRWPRSVYWYPRVGGAPTTYYTGDAEYFFILEDVDLGTRRGVRFTPKNNWDGLAQVIIDWTGTTRTIGLLVRGGKVRSEDGKGFVDYWQFDQSFTVGKDLRNAIATVYPDTTYDGKPPHPFPSLPNLNTSLPPKPTLRELE